MLNSIAESWDDGGTCFAVGLAVDPSLRAMPPQACYASSSTVAALVSRAIEAAGFRTESAHADKRGSFFAGMSVLLKPNWVLDRNEGDGGMECMITHPTVVEAVASEILRDGPSKLVLGDAPIQSCDWNRIVPWDVVERLSGRCAEQGTPFQLVDFRRRTLSGLGQAPRENLRGVDRYVLFDLREDSLLEPISIPAGKFRVTNYDPRKLAERHCPGRHQYLLCREAFEADIVVSLPKLKLHRKAGITAALKNVVGLNGNKDYLPHHRAGGVAVGGDCYPGRSLRKRLVEQLLDLANRSIGTKVHAIWLKLALAGWSRVARTAEGGLEGGWYGNDTVWRTVLDLNRILRYGRADGSMADSPQRLLLSVTDAVVCGDREGPLAPSPRVVGAITASFSAPHADVFHAAMLGMDYQKIPLVREAFGGYRWPLATPDASFAAFDGIKRYSLKDVAATFGVAAVAPLGWRGAMEATACPS